MRCENCHRHIGIINKLRHRFFHAKYWVHTIHGLFKYETDIYFCSNKCIAEYEWTHPSARILN